MITGGYNNESKFKSISQTGHKKEKHFCWCRFFLIIVIIFTAHIRNSQTMILEKTEYDKATNTEIYAFKGLSYAILDDFSSDDLLLDEGQKVNGYEPLTKNQMVVNQTFANQQIATIDQIMADEQYNQWDTVLTPILDKQNTALNLTTSEKSEFSAALLYAGEDKTTLLSEKENYENLADNTARDISLNNLYFSTSGYLYSSISDQDQYVSETILPYITEDWFAEIKKASTQETTALKIVNNDHCFLAFSLPADTYVMDEEEALSIKQENMDNYSDPDDAFYYQYLIKRVDQLRYFPRMTFTVNDQLYSAYLVNVVSEDDQKILVLMLEDNVKDFAETAYFTADINLEAFNAFILPESAIIYQGDQTYVKIVSKGYFETLTEVFVNKIEKGDAILAIADNPDLDVNSTIRVYP